MYIGKNKSPKNYSLDIGDFDKDLSVKLTKEKRFTPWNNHIINRIFKCNHFTIQDNQSAFVVLLND